MADVSNSALIGCTGALIVATRGDAGAGEVLLTVRGSREAYLAWSDRPLQKGTEVLVIGTRGPRTVLVEPWPGLSGRSAGVIPQDPQREGDHGCSATECPIPTRRC